MYIHHKVKIILYILLSYTDSAEHKSNAKFFASSADKSPPFFSSFSILIPSTMNGKHLNGRSLSYL